MNPARARTQCGFTLLELAVVLALIGVIAGMGLVTLTGSIQASQVNTTVQRMDNIEKALLNYAVAFNRIPCPSSLTLTPSNTNYGIEAANKGTCTGGTPAANFSAVSGTVEGGVPTRALQLPDSYMYDAWGRRFRYAVDPTYTAASALPFPAGGPCTASASGITVNDSTGAARTTAAIYAIISSGANGHGGYTANGVMVNAGSTNTDEQTNCHCNASAASTTYAPTYVEKAPTLSSSSALNSFDDLVTFKEGWQMQALNFSLASKLSCNFIYVADGANNRVQVLNSSGTWVGSIGGTSSACTSCMCTSSSGCPTSSGSGNGQLNFPDNVVFDSHGNLWVDDEGNGRIDEFSASGSYLGQVDDIYLNGYWTFAYWVAIDSGNNLWVVDYTNNRVVKYNSSGSELLAIGTGYQGAGGSIGSSGSGNGQFNGPSSATVDSGNNVWVSDGANYRVEEFNSSGSFLLGIGSGYQGAGGSIGSSGSGNGQFGSVGTIGFNSSGNLWVEDAGNRALKEFNSSGSYLGPVTNSIFSNGDFMPNFALDSSGNFWLAGQTNNDIYELNSSGTLLKNFGSGGSGNGQFNRPQGIAIGR